ncbi:MAG: hypothetical protein JJ896_13615 [Rhodothermales bacterium]|nr:hypothetical protein [Rhodothermales bacterium]MBO6780686.1 hypothetical protein [Rhodothermales bacterium]
MSFYRTYLLPGLVFQSLVIGGGYGTGRELVEFFMQEGPVVGLWGMGIATLIWGVVIALTFELCRLGGHRDYRSFLRGLLGRWWPSYEVVYLIGLVLVVSVLGSAAGRIAAEMTGAPDLVGNALVIALVGVLAFYGTGLIERVLSVWSVALYAVFAAVVLVALSELGDGVRAALTEAPNEGSSLRAGARYAAYNVGLVPAILFVTRHLPSRRAALISGGLAGVLAMLPGVLIYLAMLGVYPAVLTEPVPSDFVLATLDLPLPRLVFQVILFGTFVETGISLVHGFNLRLDGMLTERGRSLKRSERMAVAAGMLVVALFVADAVGLIALIASGYGALTWAYWLVFVLPVLVVGLRRLLKPAVG